MRDFNDINEAAASAYTEVMERTQQETAAPREPVRTDARGVDTMDDVVVADKPTGQGNDKGGKNGVLRDDGGRFAAKQGGKEPADGTTTDGKDKAPAGQHGKDAANPAEAPVEAATDVKGGPPSSFSPKSKLAWDNADPALRADILKREGEMQEGLKALRDYKDLKQYADMATKNNTTIPAYLERTLRIEQMLKTNMGHGLASICEAYGMKKQEAAALFADLAKRFGGEAPTQNGGGQPDPLLEALSPLLSPMQKELGELRSQLGARSKQEQDAQLASLEKAIAEFSAKPENRFYSDLEEKMFALIERGDVPLNKTDFGATLRAAYDLAARMNPAISEALIEQRLQQDRESRRKAEQEAVSKAKSASRSIAGTGTPGLKVQDTKEPVGANHRDSVLADARRAYQLHSQG